MALIAGLGGLGIAGATGLEACDNASELPEPIPVLNLPQGELQALLEPLPGLPGLEANDFHECSGKIRPGVYAVFNNAWLCTLNWIYTDNLGRLYIGTAGHCAPSVGSMNINVAGIGDIGDVAFTTGSQGVGNDFALIAITSSLYSFVDPTLCHWGGPQGVHSSGGNKVLLHYGHGSFWGEDQWTRPRAGLVQAGGWSSTAITFRGAVGPGDSGSPIMVSEGGAAGVITHTASLQFPHIGLQFANRVDSGLARANAAQGKGYRVVTSSIPPDLTGVLVPE